MAVVAKAIVVGMVMLTSVSASGASAVGASPTTLRSKIESATKPDPGIKTEIGGTISQWAPLLTSAGTEKFAKKGDVHLTMLDTVKYGLVQIDMGSLHLQLVPGSKYRAIGTLYSNRRFVPSEVIEMTPADPKEVDQEHNTATAPSAEQREAIAKLSAGELSKYLAANPSPPAGASTSGPATMLIVPFYCSSATTGNAPGTNTPTDFESLITNVVSPWYSRQTHGNRTFVPVSTPWLDLCAGGTSIGQDAAALNAGFDPATYDRVVYVDAAPNPWV